MANDAVVGVLRALLTMDTSGYEAGAKKAASVNKQVEKTITDIGKETTKLTPQAERMVKAFSGDKLIYQAKNMAAAIEKIGGASKLTTAELERAGNVAKAAAEKMRALGVDVPKNIDALAKSAKTGSGSVSLLSSGIASLGATLGATFTVGAVLNAINRTGEWAGKIDDLSKKLGITRESVQRLSFAADQNGASIDQVSTAISQLAKRLVEGDKSAATALDRLNLSFADLQSLSPDQAFVRVAKAIANLPDKFEQQATAMELLGRAGADLLPMFASLESDMNRAVVVSEELIKAGDALGDSWSALKNVGMALVAGTVTSLVGPMDQLTAKMNAYAQFVLDAAEAQRRLNDELARTGQSRSFMTVLDEIERERMVGQAERGVTRGRMPAQLPRQAFLPEDAERMMDRAERATKKAHDEAKKLLVTQERMNGLAFTYAKYLESWAPAIQNANESAQLLTNYADNLAGLSQAMPAWIDSERVSEEVTDIEPELSRLQRMIESDFESMSLAVSDAFAQMLTHATSFKDGFLNIWRAIQRGISNILGDILNEFVGGFLRGMLNAASGGRLGGGGGVVGTAANAASVAGLFGGGSAVSASFLASAPGLGATGSGIVAGEGIGAVGGASGGAAGGGSFLMNPAFWTNPYTIAAIGGAALLTWGITKKGWFRGGEEGILTNPKRDQYFGQFVSMFGGSPYEAIVKAHQRAGVSPQATDAAIHALYAAHSYKDFQTAERRDLNLLAAGGLRGLKSFKDGGFTPPYATQLALTHGGSMGELHIPVQKLADMRGHSVRTTHIHVPGYIDVAGFKRLYRDVILPMEKAALGFNTDDLTTVVRREVMP